MDPVTVLQSGLAAILLAVRARIVAVTGISENQVKLWARSHRTCPQFQSPRDVVLVPGPASPTPGWQEGAGRIASVVQRPLHVVARTQLAFGTSDSDWSALTDTLGLETLEDALATALVEPWFPEDVDGNHLTISPLLLMPGTQPDDNAEDRTWAQATLGFELNYELPLGTTDPL